jgi:hypothetical protein
MALDGRVTPGLRAEICEAFHVLMVPSKMPASVAASSLIRLVTPGRLYEIETPPRMSGIWITGPADAGTLARSEEDMGTSEAPKATVPAWKSEMPAPLPTPE